MSLSSSKLLKLALGLIVGTTSAGTIALGAYLAQSGASRLGDSQAVDVPAAKAENRSGEKAAAVSQGILDRYSERIADMPARPGAIRPVRITSEVIGDLAPPLAFGSSDLREIEAELLNAYPAYESIEDLIQRTPEGPSKQALILTTKVQREAVVKPVRLLLARLLALVDRQADMEQAIKDKMDLLDDLSNESAKLDREYESAFAHTNMDSALERRRLEWRLNRIVDEIDRGRESIAVAKHDLMRLQSAIRPLNRQAADVDRLIKWTREHFKEVQLTIDDAAPDAK